ncbi:MAG: hypothetical protein RSB98_04665 [Raoultibacter sp.]
MDLNTRTRELLTLAAYNVNIAANAGDLSGNLVNYGTVIACIELLIHDGWQAPCKTHMQDKFVIIDTLTISRINGKPSIQGRLNHIKTMNERNEARDKAFAQGELSANEHYQKALTAIINEHNAFVDFVGTMRVPLEQFFSCMGIASRQSRLGLTITEQVRGFGINAKCCAQSGKIIVEGNEDVY